ncbi:Protein cms1 [Teratosphaeriaceae sp. CCFEE 6253]|nr:Protein cms1 [Teratosphaeriaceae sp. CCFEE 6253]
MSDSDGDHGGVPLVEGFGNSASPEPQQTTKRKREDETKPESKRAAKRKKTKKPKDVDDEALDVELGVNHAIAHMDSRLLADHIAQRTKHFQPDMSMVEAEDLHIPERAIMDTTSWDRSRATDDLASFVEKFAGPRRSKKGRMLVNAPKEKGSPHTLIVAGAGLRAADLTRALRRFQTKESMVAKLFAKHIKIKEAVEMVGKLRMGIGVGTPQRIIDLLEDGVLKTTHLERIVIDASHIDLKKRGILDMKETQGPLVQLLSRPSLKESYGCEAGKVELLFY